MTEQNQEEFDWLLAIVRVLKPRTILEIGSRMGESLKSFIDSSPSITKAVAVDLFEERFDKRVEWTKWGTSALVVPIQGNSASQSTIDRVSAHAPFDFVFIDADHTYGGMRGDWTVYGPMCDVNGIVAFHDISPTGGNDFGGFRFWPELKRSHYTAEKIVNPKREGYGIGVVFGRTMRTPST